MGFAGCRAAKCDSPDVAAGSRSGPLVIPDGTYVVFSSNGPKRDNPDLYVQQIGVTAPPYRLTSDPANDYSPSWSPDGGTIAFLRRGPAGDKSEVWRIAPLEGPSAKWQRSGPACPPSDQPRSRGARIPHVCSSRIRLAPTNQTHCFGFAGNGRSDSSPSAESEERPIAIHRRQRLVFRRDATPGSGEFYRLSLKDTNDSEAIGAPDVDPLRGKPVWIPDSREILFAARGGLWRLDTSTGDAKPAAIRRSGRYHARRVANARGRAAARVRGSFPNTNVWRVDTARGSPGRLAASRRDCVDAK